MSTPSGGHAVHLTSSSREHQNGAGPSKNIGGGIGGKIQQQIHKHQLINSGNEPLHQQLAGVHASAHLHTHTDLDPRVMSGGGGGHHGPPPPPPPKVKAMGMMDAWTRMPPQYASQQTSLEPQFIGSSPAAYYHAPVSPYGAAYAGIGGENNHGGAPWSNGTDVASYFGYPPGPTSGDFRHPESMSIPGMFGNGYPAGTYGAPSNFGYSPFTPTHTAPGPAVSQDYTGWAPTAPHDILDRGAHPKNPYGDYYSYDLIGAATPSIITPTGAAIEVGNAPIPVGCDERVKSLGNHIENLSIAPMVPSLAFSNSNREFEQQRLIVESRPAVVAVTSTGAANSKKLEASLHQESSTENLVNRGSNGETPFLSASESSATSAVTERAQNNNNDDAYNGDDRDVDESSSSRENNSTPKAMPTTKTQSFPHPAKNDGRDSPSTADSHEEPSTSGPPEVGHDGENTESDTGTVTTPKPSMNLRNWNWSDEEVKDWSASPPPPLTAAALPVPGDDDWHSTQIEDDRNQDDDNCEAGVDEQTSKRLLQELIRKNNYNPRELDARIEGALFFVIKSYSEDDVHRSIKYSIWCSTEHGNKKLDQAFRHQKNNGASGPIYLFYSVNGSGHFCGMAQMTSSVDYDTLTGVWAQDKWKGKFSVKWIYVKDIPNQELRHIRLENNENKPVTNSRDTQEIPPEKGRQVLEIMHNYRHETSLFDDFVYYEDMEHKREAERENHHTKDRSSPSSGARSTSATTFRNFPPKRKEYGDDVRDGHPSNGNHHHHQHRDNHHHGKDFYHRTDSREHLRNPAVVGGARSFSGGASGSSSGNYNHSRDSSSRGFGGGYRGEADAPRSGNHVGRSFTNFRRNTDRDRDFAGSERTFISDRYNTTLRSDSAHWRS